MLWIGFPFRTIPKFLDRKTTGAEMSMFSIFPFPLSVLLWEKKIKNILWLASQWTELGGLTWVLLFS